MCTPEIKFQLSMKLIIGTCNFIAFDLINGGLQILKAKDGQSGSHPVTRYGGDQPHRTAEAGKINPYLGALL